MKQFSVLFACLLSIGTSMCILIGCTAHAQGSPNHDQGHHWHAKDTTRAARVQCWGTTSKGQRCKRMINPKAPGAAVMDAGGVYYCYQHASQAK